MPFADYDALRASCLAWNWNRNSNRIDDFIALAHSQINLYLRSPFMHKTADITIDAKRVVTPTDFQAVSRFYIDGSLDDPMTPLSPEALQAYHSSYTTSQPTRFAIEGGDTREEFVFNYENGSFDGKLSYVRRLADFNAGTDTNLVLTRYPFLYVDGVAMEAARYGDDDSRFAKFESQFFGKLTEVNTRTRDDAYGGGPLRPLPQASGI